MDKDIKLFFDRQIKDWELAGKNFHALEFVKKKSFKCGDLEGYIQFNPARAVSTLAKVDKTSIGNRKCFLCDENRPVEQKSIEILTGWFLLVNPFPILPYHFTIVNNKHIPQNVDLNVGIELAKRIPGFVVFYNDDGAGASAPDHMHFQAVPLEELPLIRLFNTDRENIGVKDFPFRVLNNVKEIKNSHYPMNLYFWVSEYSGDVKVIGVPRKAHRPKEYFLEAPFRRAISPGAIDMAGVLVTPIEEDFESTDDSDVEKIFRQVGFLGDE